MAEPISSYEITKDFLPTIFALVAIIVSWFSVKKSSQLQRLADDANNQRHWRREKIYNLADDLRDLATDYWLAHGSDPKNPKTGILINVKFDDLENNASTMSLNISTHIAVLRHLITGGKFDDPDREPLDFQNQKFLQIHQECEKIKEQLAGGSGSNLS